jgi:hypothetical protein
VILVYNPTFLFLIPGLLILATGLLLTLLVFLEVSVLGRGLYVHSLIVGCLLLLLGVQAVGLGICARTFGVYYISERDDLLRRLGGRFRLEHGLAFAVLVGMAGIALFGLVLVRWAAEDFGPLSEVRLAILSATLIAIGAQIFFTSFLLSILGLRRRADDW